MVLDSVAGQDRKSTPPKTPFAEITLQDAELLSVEGHNLGDRLPGRSSPVHYAWDLGKSSLRIAMHLLCGTHIRTTLHRILYSGYCLH